MMPQLHSAGADPDAHSVHKFALGARAAYLGDHCPGGQPLFGTVMGIEAMAAAFAKVQPWAGQTRRVAVDICIDAPLILTAGQAHAEIEVRSTRLVVDGADAVACVLGSISADKVWQQHFSATFFWESGPVDVPPWTEGNWARTVQSAAPVQVSAASIYGLFFHGPAFQVVKSAFLVDSLLCSEYQTALPGLFDCQNLETNWKPHKQPGCAGPQQLELCLQTAGLLDVATSARMMIPHHIERIDWHLGEKGPGAGALRAVARRCLPNVANGFDMVLGHPTGPTWALVKGYVCTPLPFDCDLAAIERLRQCFHRQ